MSLLSGLSVLSSAGSSISGRLFGSVSPAPVVSTVRLANVLANATPAELDRLFDIFARAYNNGPAWPATLQEQAKLLSGGDDGKFTSLLGKELRDVYWALDAKYGGTAPVPSTPKGTSATDVISTIGRIADAASGKAVPSATASAGVQTAFDYLPLILIGGVAAYFAVKIARG